MQDRTIQWTEAVDRPFLDGNFTCHRCGHRWRYAIEDMKTAERIHQIEEFEYELSVRDESTGYFGSWFCRACWKGGVVYDIMPSVSDAMTQAEELATAHHESAHPKNQQTYGH